MFFLKDTKWQKIGNVRENAMFWGGGEETE